MLRETSQSLPKMNDSPNVENVDPDSPISRMKKKTSRARISTARDVSAPGRPRSGKRLSGDRSRTERPPLAVVAPASNERLLAERRSVAGHRLELRLGLAQPRGRERRLRKRVRACAEGLLSVAERVVEPVEQPLGGRGA